MNDGRRCICIDTGIEFGGVQTEVGSVLFQIRLGECANILALPYVEQLVVIFPEFSLLVSAFRSFGRPMRLADGTLIDYREIFIRERNLVGLDILVSDLARRANCKLSADRSLKVGIFGEGYLGAGITDRPTAGGDATAHLRRCGGL